MSRILDIAKRVRSQQMQRHKIGNPPSCARRRLSEFASAGELLPVRLSLLNGEIIYLASDNTPIDTSGASQHQGHVVYRAREWAKLYVWRKQGHLDDAAFRLVHEAKKVFGGEISP